MDIVVNQYLDNLPPYSTTLKGVNNKYNLNMEAYNTLEYYAEKIQSELDLMEEDDEGEEDDSQMTDSMEDFYDPEKMHDMWCGSHSAAGHTFVFGKSECTRAGMAAHQRKSRSRRSDLEPGSRQFCQYDRRNGDTRSFRTLLPAKSRR